MPTTCKIEMESRDVSFGVVPSENIVVKPYIYMCDEYDGRLNGLMLLSRIWRFVRRRTQNTFVSGS